MSRRPFPRSSIIPATLPLAVALAIIAPVARPAHAQAPTSVTVPFTLDHNRMLVEVEIRRADGTWRPALLWVDTGNPNMMMSEALARDLGMDLSGAVSSAEGGFARVPPPADVRVGGMPLAFEGVTLNVHLEPHWIFGTMRVDANLPSTVLQRYQVVFDYPRRRLTIARPGTLPHRGERLAASVNRATGIVQVDAAVGADTMSLALDIGASYSFVSGAVLSRLAERNPSWSRATGAVGCANIWGRWPEEAAWPMVRAPEMRWGPERLTDVVLVGLPDFFGNASLGDWYSRKTARRVEGFLGPNAVLGYRVEIDYADEAIWLERGSRPDPHDLDVVGLTIRRETDGRYTVVGVPAREGRPAVEGVEPGDVLLEVDSLTATGATMGTVVDALRGRPGRTRTLVLERAGRRFTVTARVERFL